MADTGLLIIDNLTKSFDENMVLKGISLSIDRGEFITLLGPSGCGKTTTLRIIAGLERPDAGHVWLDGKDVTHIEPNKRNVNTVFQNYALFPHMNVERNIGYGLRVRKVAKAEINRRITEMLDLVQLPGYEKRMPSQLSGGQRQRVAIARAVVLRPDVLLLDEPLGALDLKLRQQMQEELKSLQKRLGITFIYITHDQEEALNMSDRIAIMSDGQFEQIGSPEEIYEHPASRFVAKFIGESTVLEGRIVEVDGNIVTMRTPAGVIMAQKKDEFIAGLGKIVAVNVHAERIQYSVDPVPGFELRAVVHSHRFAGSMLKTDLLLKDGTTITANSVSMLSQLPGEGSEVFVHWDTQSGSLIPEEVFA